ncbi:scavenger receptor cysteine-rich type 1 protein M130-like [Hemitrygon akajei]|uniref:scavenger receptor cysteine-rich type 1 protein M130-like n=1 Tax=Hemitrygon akajei TaxID=2704970 RepID=UPI003BF9D02B
MAFRVFYCCRMSKRVKFDPNSHSAARLVSANDECSVRLEVQFDDTWGTVCDLCWAVNDANMVCNQLQCGSAVSVLEGAYFGEGKGQRIFGLQRLTDGGNRCDGRVEVYVNGTWRRVQDKFWNICDANVVCRQMRCGNAIHAYNSSRPRERERPAQVIDVQCEGSRLHLRDCRMSVLNQYSSENTGDGVLCSRHLQIRLSGSEDACAGRLEVYYRGSWGTVCDDSWDMDDANVVCRQLACGFSLQDKTREYYGECSKPICLNELRCSCTESYLWECPSAPFGEPDCSHKEDVTVTCSEYKPVRLENGNYPCEGREGRVEIWYKGTWGTVCSTTPDAKSTEVICKQMKCIPLKYVYPGSYRYGKGHGPIWLVGCHRMFIARVDPLAV